MRPSTDFPPATVATIDADLTETYRRYQLWCDTCLTSARIEVDLLMLTDHGVSPFGTVKRCLRCDCKRKHEDQGG